MKYFNNNNYKLLCIGLLALAAPSCTKDFEGLNVNTGNISDADLAKDGAEAAFLLPIMMNNIVATSTGHQTQQNLQAESYANYLEAPSNFIGNVNPTTYVTRGIWPNSYNVSTNNVMNNWLTMSKKGYDTKYPDLYAIALIMKAAAAQRLVDTFGPYPYTKYGNTAEPKFDSPAEAYAAIFVDLDKAVVALLAAEAADKNADVARFSKWDRSSFKGEYTKWIKLANTIRLRMAMRISVVDPAKGKVEAEKAVAVANGGVMDAASGSFTVSPSNGVSPYFTYTNAWSDTRISAAVITYLQGYGDGRLPIYALTATDPAVAGTYRGIRPGVDRPSKTIYENYSKYNVAETSHTKVVDVAESYFLRAEGVLRGWNMGGGTAKQWYEDGVKTSFTANGAAGADAYLQSTSKQLAYVDPKRPNNQYDSAPLTDNVVMWDEAANFETKLEKVITQKWIAVFPEGTEGWSEFRRTGYPKLYNIMAPQNPKLPLGTFIKRLTYPTAVASASKAAYDAAVAAHLGGRDDEDVKFYWMK
ncbi:Susd and RagB outer membrane lipoprotein [Daejeonella rubra]|uniref:Susd and RagB outer membrane lipoprotein n=1 Tax=Daejeonella rubra TaxID=990371 RepID=A0A1G9SGG1_9SPHI|nr:SusD/RagB family nutrient-binding outer membrane lipoprotein [Daejeonella rubra]SDM34529.1 Susd and RagB outer membrane lipoprotein [Daejeonella rubra]